MLIFFYPFSSYNCWEVKTKSREVYSFSVFLFLFFKVSKEFGGLWIFKLYTTYNLKSLWIWLWRGCVWVGGGWEVSGWWERERLWEKNVTYTTLCIHIYIHIYTYIYMILIRVNCIVQIYSKYTVISSCNEKNDQR